MPPGQASGQPPQRSADSVRCAVRHIEGAKEHKRVTPGIAGRKSFPELVIGEVFCPRAWHQVVSQRTLEANIETTHEVTAYQVRAVLW